MNNPHDKITILKCVLTHLERQKMKNIKLARQLPLKHLSIKKYREYLKLMKKNICIQRSYNNLKEAFNA